MERARRDRPRRGAFTLLELMLVMVLLGIVAGIGLAGFDRIDPGYRALESSLTSFVESSRDRARGSGYPVVLSLRAADPDRPARMQRAVFRPVLEASFEGRFRGREGVEVRGDAELDLRGRFGAGLDLAPGGEAIFAGRGLPDLSRGFSMSFDFRDRDLNGGEMLHWEGLLDLRLRRGGVLEVILQAGDGDFYQDVRLELPPDAIKSGRWQAMRLTAVDQELVVHVDGKVVARTTTPPVLGSPRAAMRFGSMERGWAGMIDEVEVLARTIENGPELPDEVTLEAILPVHFDRHGTLDPRRQDGAGVPVVLRSFDDEVSRFLIGRFTQEVMP